MLWFYIENDTFFGPALSKRTLGSQGPMA